MLAQNYPIQVVQQFQRVQKLSQVFQQLKNYLNLLTKKLTTKYQKILVTLT